MPTLIKSSAITSDHWLPADAQDSQNKLRISTLEQWLALDEKQDSTVQLEPGDDPAVLYDALSLIKLIAINFPAFTDGRGFSYARDIKEQGYKGEIRAVGHFIRDQLTYMSRVGFDSFAFEEASSAEDALNSLCDFSEHYQASIDQPQPLFRRRG